MADATDLPRPLVRLPSGIAGLDAILHGGFLRGGSYIILGEPGNGKTILANQICFHHVATGGRVVYLTMLAETHAQMLTHLRSFAFFDPAQIGTAVVYFSGYRVLETEGLSGLMELVRGAVRDQQATLLVIDGLSSVEAFAESPTAFKRFLYELRAYLDVIGCTTFLTANGGPQSHPEHTVVDGVIELHYTPMGLCVMRDLEARKFRGSDHLLGRHMFTISKAGISVYPRTEALLASPSSIARDRGEWLSTGVSALDTMLGGGLLAGSTTMLLGAPGSGKTMLGLHFLAASARSDEPGLYFGFFETPPRLIGKGDRVGLDLSTMVAREEIEILWQPPLEGHLDQFAGRLLEAIRRRGISRLFIDGIDGFQAAAAYPERVAPFFMALCNELRGLDVTTIFSIETHALFSPEIAVPITGVSAIAENIILLRFVELESRLVRLISMMKVRDSAYDSTIREFQITDQGIHVAAPFGSAQAVLTGVARPRGSGSGQQAPAKRRSRGAGRR